MKKRVNITVDSELWERVEGNRSDVVEAALRVALGECPTCKRALVGGSEISESGKKEVVAEAPEPALPDAGKEERLAVARAALAKVGASVGTATKEADPPKPDLPNAKNPEQEQVGKKCSACGNMPPPGKLGIDFGPWHEKQCRRWRVRA